MSNSIKLFHPLCHYINGERLYFILISFRVDVLKRSSAFVKKILSDFPCLSSSCMYSIFGDLDLLIRFWASDEDVTEIDACIKSLSDEIRYYRLILVDDANTWYQHKLDVKANDGEKKLFGESDVKAILNNKHLENEDYFYLKSDGPEQLTKYKIWMILEDRSSSYTDLFCVRA
jgi:hypothetical protein